MTPGTTTISNGPPPAWARHLYEMDQLDGADQFLALLTGITDFDRRLYAFGIRRGVDLIPNINFWEACLRMAAEEHPDLREKGKRGPKPKAPENLKPDRLAEDLFQAWEAENSARATGTAQIPYRWTIEKKAALIFARDHHNFEDLCHSYQTRLSKLLKRKGLARPKRGKRPK